MVQISPGTTMHATLSQPATAGEPNLVVATRHPPRVQTRVGLVLAPSASAATLMMLLTAMPNSFGMGTPLSSHRKVTKVPNSGQQDPATPCASTGTCPGHAAPTHTFPGTAVPAVEAMTTEPSPADSLSPRFKTSTPYQPDKWRSLLQIHDLCDKYGHIPFSLQYGFNAGVKYIPTTFTPCNDKSITTYHEVFQQIITREFSVARYEGPFSQQQVEDYIGPFQSSPLSIIPKPHKPGKFRIIQNFSSPYTSDQGFRSINVDITSSHFPCTWGTFDTISNTIHHLPPGSQVAVHDIAEAYRTIPIKQSQWPGTVVHISDSKFAIDKCLAFGCTSSAGVFGNLADAAVDIFRAEGIGPISKWVDDFVFFRMPTSQVNQFN